MKLLNGMIPAVIFGLAVTFTPKLKDIGSPKEIWANESAKVTPKINYSKDLFSFMSDVANFESDGNYKAVNRYGMMGKYQFHRLTLKEMGMKVTKAAFLKNEDLQDSAMVLYMKQNKEELLPYIQKYSGKKVHGILITESSMLAGAHFVGTTGVINFLKYGKIRKDGNGTSLVYYMSKFNGYNLDKLSEL